MSGVLLIVEYLVRVLPALVLIAAVFIWAKPRAEFRIVLYIFSFILLRDAMTPLGLWEFSTRGGAFWLRLSSDPVFLVLFGLTSLAITAALVVFDRENRPHLHFLRGNAAVGLPAGVLGGVLVVLPFLFLYRGIPLAARGGAVPSGLLPALLVFALLGNLFEELLFRGYAMGKLNERFGRWQSAVLSGLLFAMCHVFLATTVTDAGIPLLVFTLWEGILCGLIGTKYGIIPAALTHGGAIFLLSSGLL
ncbi:MAG: CPBP family intramembrane glutamic endopeptidase [Spirochaeta sp.]